MNIGDVKIKLILDSGQFDSSVDKSSSKIKEVEIATNRASVSTVKFSSHLQNFALQMQGLTSIYTILKSTIASSISEFMKSEVALSKLSRGLWNVGEGGVEAFKKLNTQASELQKITPFADEEITNAQAMLTTFQKSSEEIEILTPRMLDLAAAYMKSGDSSMDLQQVAVMLGKVNEDTVGQLKRVGVAFSKEQEEKLKSLKGTEQAIYLSQILDQNFKGLAETVGNTTAGQMTRLQNAIGELKEALGKGIVKGFVGELDEANASSKELIDTLNSLGETVTWLGKQVSDSPGIGSLIITFAKLKAGTIETDDALKGLIYTALSGMPVVGYEMVKLGELMGIFTDKTKEARRELVQLSNFAADVSDSMQGIFKLLKSDTAWSATLDEERLKELEKKKPGSKGPGRSSTSDYKIEKDAVDELINSLKEQYEIYKSNDEIKKRLNQSGLDELSIIQKLTVAIADTTYTTEQILKLDKYRGELAEIILKKQQELNELRQQEIDQLQIITDNLERGLAERKKEFYGFERDVMIKNYEMKLAFIENEFTKRKTLIQYSYEKELELFRQSLVKQNLEKEQYDKLYLSRKKVLDEKKTKDLAALERDKYVFILDALSKGTNAASSIAQLLGIGAENFIFRLINGLANAINLVTQIKELLEAIGIIKSIISFIGMATGMGSVAVGVAGGGGIGLPDNVGGGFPGASQRVVQVPYIATVSAKGRDIFVTLQKEKSALMRRTI